MSKSRFYLWPEFIALYIGLPVFIAYLRDRTVMLGLLWVAAVAVIIWLNRFKKRNLLQELNWSGFKEGIKMVLVRFAIIGPVLFAFMYFVHPEELFSFPLERPKIYAYVMVWYPLLSVIPQELLYKSLFFGRYGRLFPNDKAMILACAVMFGFLHIILLSWLPVAITTVAGLLMAHTYSKTRSLALVSLEHTLYGCWAYTLGMGMYLHTGHAWGQVG